MKRDPQTSADGAPGKSLVVDTEQPPDTGGGQPKMPHERDESSGMTGGVQSDVAQQGHRDLAKGLEDTSRAPEADRAYRDLKNK